MSTRCSSGLRQNVLLVLQVLAVLFLIYSVLGLRIHGHTSAGRHYILMIDNSASMSATDVAPNRLDWAKQEALKEIDAAGDDDFAWSSPSTPRRPRCRRTRTTAASCATPSAASSPRIGPPASNEALALAESLANPVRSTEDTASQPENVPPDQERTFVPVRGVKTMVHLYSDGRYAKLSEATLASLNSRLRGRPMRSAAQPAVSTWPGSRGRTRWTTSASSSSAQSATSKTRSRSAGRRARGQQLLVTAPRRQLPLHPGGGEAPPRRLRRRPALPAAAADAGARAAGRDAADDAAGKAETIGPGEKGVDLKLPPLDLGKHIVLHAYLDKHKDDFPLDDEAGWR